MRYVIKCKRSAAGLRGKRKRKYLIRGVLIARTKRRALQLLRVAKRRGDTHCRIKKVR